MITLQRYILCGLFLLLLGRIQLTDVNQAAHTQTSMSPIYSAGDIRSLYWSPDSSTLVFQDVRGAFFGAVLAGGEYFAYDVRSGNLTSNSVWPLQPNLTAQEMEIYEPIRSADDYMLSTGTPDVIDEFMFLSPNERFMVYVTGTDPRERRFAIADRNTISAKTFDLLAGNTSEIDAFFTLWSADSRSVVIGNRPLLDVDGFVRYFYITNYADDVQAATIEEITLDAIVNEREYQGAVVQDISQDNQTLLIMTADIAKSEAGELEYFTSAQYRIYTTPSVLDIFENNLVSYRRLICITVCIRPS